MSAHKPSEAATPISGSTAPLLAAVEIREGELLGGRYKIECCLGGGGMASIYRAIHIGLDQPVAVKVVSPSVRELPGVVSRFMREARSATRLKGEHVVRVFDVGTRTTDGAPYLVMELLEGKDLGELLDEGFKPTLVEAIDYMLQACEALAEVHGLGIVHRDLKPANLFITRGPDGRSCLKLIDFGISRVDSPLSPKDAVALTSPEVVMGSPRYMPPEQMESSASADSRSDIWGLGAILYEMLVGNAPFDGESLWDIYAASVRAPPPRPTSVRTDLPNAIDEILLKCLRVDPNERYADVAELAAALAPLGDEGAAARAEAITRVLETSLGRGHGDDANGWNPKEKGPTSSRIRRRLLSSTSHRRATRIIGTIAAGALLAVGLLLAARPTARVNAPPTATESADTNTTTTTSVMLTATTTAPTAPPELAAAAPAATPTQRPPPPPATPSAPRWSAPTPAAPAAAAAVNTAMDPVSPAAPPLTASPPARADDRTLFEERK